MLRPLLLYVGSGLGPEGRNGHGFDHLAGQAGSTAQRLVVEMGIALGGADLGMSEQVLHDVKRDPAVDEEAGKGVAQVMKAHVLQSGPVADADPGVEQAGGGAACRGAREDVAVAGQAFDGAQQAKRLVVEIDEALLAGFGDGNAQCGILPIDQIPGRMGDFVASGSGEEKEQDRLGGNLVLVFLDGEEEGTQFVTGEEALAVLGRQEGEISGRVLGDAGDLPAPGEIEDETQEDDGAVDGAGRIALVLHGLDEGGDVFGRDGVHGPGAEGRQDVDPEHGLIGLPAALGLLRMGKVAVADESGKRRNGQLLPTAGLRVLAQMHLGDDSLGLLPGLVEGKGVGGANPDAVLLAVVVGVALTIGLGAGVQHFEIKAALFGVGVFDLRLAGRTGGGADVVLSEVDDGHGVSTDWAGRRWFKRGRPGCFGGDMEKFTC